MSFSFTSHNYTFLKFMISLRWHVTTVVHTLPTTCHVIIIHVLVHVLHTVNTKRIRTSLYILQYNRDTGVPGYSPTKCPEGTRPSLTTTPLPPPSSRLPHTSRENPNISLITSLPLTWRARSSSGLLSRCLYSFTMHCGSAEWRCSSREESWPRADFSCAALSVVSLCLTWLGHWV